VTSDARPTFDEPATIRTAPLDPTAARDGEVLAPAGRDHPAGAPGVQVVTVPADADAEAVDVRVPMVGGQEVGFIYERPGG
jgi:hypothetical protein